MRQQGKRERLDCVLIFGESDNDREALKELTRALRPDLPQIEKRSKPLVLVKGRTHASASDNIEKIANLVKAERVRRDVKLVIAHEDCDGVEPAHEQLAREIERLLAHMEVLPAVAAVSAFEIEAWWYLWPRAVLGVNKNWRHPNRKGQEVGRIPNVKEALRRDLRPAAGKNTRDYYESDSQKIAAIVRKDGLIDQPEAISQSFFRFARCLRAIHL
jgi:hypothetical protein